MRIVVGLALLGLCGCGTVRHTWVYDRRDIQDSPVARQRYKISSFVVTPFHGKSRDAVLNVPGRNSKAMSCEVNSLWIDYLYERYPDIFSREGVPVEIKLKEKILDKAPAGFERSAWRSFFGKIGFVTLLPVIPAEAECFFEWQMAVSLANSEGTGEVVSNEIDETLLSITPLGLLCCYGQSDFGAYQVSGGLCSARRETDFLHKRLDALGVGIAAELIAMEKDGRIRVGEMGVIPTTKSLQDEDRDVRARIMSEERRKNLDSLLRAGIIDETEFAAEMKKLEGAAK